MTESEYGKWIITEEIEHDTGNVFMARNEETNEIGVLKLAKPPEPVHNFKTEIEITIRQDHPNIVKVLDYCIETPWMVTKFYEGGTLDFQTFAAMTPRQQNTCFLHVYCAILHLLSRGLAYADYTGNIFLEADGCTPVVGDLEGCRPVQSVFDSIHNIISLGVYFNMLINNPELSMYDFESLVTDSLMEASPEDL